MLTNITFKKIATACMLLAMCSMMFMTIGCSVAEDGPVNSQNPIEPQHDGILDESQLQAMLEYMQSSETVTVAESSLGKLGFYPAYDQAIGGQSEGLTGVMVPFIGTDDQHYYMLRFIQVDSTVSVDVTEVTVIDSETVNGVTYSVDKRGISAKAAAYSWWSCFWDCTFDRCGTSAISCIFAGPLWYPCVTSTCGFIAWYCAFLSCDPY